MAEITVALPAVPPMTSPRPRPLTEAALGRCLGALANRPGSLPKYRYPSAGTLYPVQAYVVLRRALGELAAGCYYHHPDEHALVRLSAATPAAPDGSMPDALLLLVARYGAIEPIYRAETERFCWLEAGYMAEALRDAGLAMRTLDQSAGYIWPREAFEFEPDHLPLVCWAVGEDA